MKLPLLNIQKWIWLALVPLACTSSKKFVSIRCVYDKDAQLRPGASVPFGVVAIHKNGQKILTKGYLKGKYKMDNYDVTVNGGWSEGGLVFIDTMQDLNVNSSVKVYVKPIKKPSLQDSFDMVLNYEGIVTWNFGGEPGKEGDSKSRRILPVRVAGTALVDGKQGDSGTKGTAAQDVVLYVYKLHDTAFYNRFGYDVYAVKATAQDGGNVRMTYIAERYGKLILKANGGDGGAGGNGGPGPDGRDADPTHPPGLGRNGGAGGIGGNGGKGGKIKIFIDTAARDFVKYLEVQNRGGRGGYGGQGGKGGRGGRLISGAYEPDGRMGAKGNNGRDGAGSQTPEIVYDYIRF